jgi:hypothetical protein
MVAGIDPQKYAEPSCNNPEYFNVNFEVTSSRLKAA